MSAVRERMGFVFHVSAGCWGSGSVVLSSPRASSSQSVLDSSLCNSLNQNSGARHTEDFRKVQYCTQTFQLLFIIFLSYFKLVQLGGKWFCSPSVKTISWECKNAVSLLEDQSFTFSWLLRRKMVQKTELSGHAWETWTSASVQAGILARIHQTW